MTTLIKCLFALVATATVALSAEPLNTKCPITHEAANPGIKSTYSKTIEFCCAKCKAQFDAAPKSYMSAITKARRGQCPLSNKSSTAGKSSVYTREVAFKDAAAKAKFDGAPDLYIAQVKQ
jgi:YHS domain-containing protein